MDNKEREPAILMDDDPSEFFGEYYDDWKNANREIVYTLCDITIEKPNLKDFRHIYWCYLQDFGYTRESFALSEDIFTLENIMEKAAWFYKEVNKDDIFHIFKGGEFAGFAAAEPEGGPDSPTAVTDIEIRHKFKNTLVLPAVMDFGMNFYRPGKNMMFNRPDPIIGIFKKHVAITYVGPFKYAFFGKQSVYKIHKIIKRAMERCKDKK